MGRYDDEDYDNDNDYEAPKPANRSSGPVATDDDDDDTVQARPVIKRGWGAADAVKNADSPFAQRLKVTEEPSIIKFLEDEPYASFRSHWVERSGQKSFTCIADSDPRGCPLCDMGNRPSVKFAFNVALVTDSGSSVKSYEVGSRVIDQLKNFHTDPRQGPLSKHYWAVSKTGKGSTSATNHQMVKERDLEDEWNLSPISEDEMRILHKAAYTPDIVSIPKRKDLLTIAAEEG